MAFEREKGFFLGAFVVNFGFTLLVLAGYIGAGVVLTQPDPPVAALLVVGAVVMIVLPIAFYPLSRTIWSAVDLWMRPLEPDEVRAADEARARTG